MVTAKQFLTETFNTDFLTSEELDTIIKAMNLFAIGKCKEQKKLCSDIVDIFPMERMSELDVRLNYQVLHCNLPEDLQLVLNQLKIKE